MAADNNITQDSDQGNLPQFNIGELLGSLLKPTPSPDSAQGALGPATLSQLGNVGATTKDATGPYQKGVAKALQQYGQMHGTQALQSGMSPQDIQNHEIMTGGNQNNINPDAMAVLQKLVQGNQQQPQSQTQTQTQNTNSNGDYQPQNGISSFFNMLGFTPTPKNQALLAEAQATRQKIGAGQPAEISEPAARTANYNALTEMQNLTNKGQKPIDPEQYLNAYSGMYQKAYDAYSKDEEAGAKLTQEALDQYNDLSDKARNGFQKGFGIQTKPMLASLQASAASLKASIDARSNFHNFMAQNSPSQVIGNIQNKINKNSSEQPSSDVSGLKIGDKFNGEKIVNIKKVK